MKTPLRSNSRPGLSLFEMLMTVAFLGVMVTLALAWFGGSSDDIRQARDQRNAQSICSLCQAAAAAGLSLASEATTSLDIVRKMAEGVTIEKGVFKGRVFRVPGLTPDELEGAARFLQVRDGQILYKVASVSRPGSTAPGEQI